MPDKDRKTKSLRLYAAKRELKRTVLNADDPFVGIMQVAHDLRNHLDSIGNLIFLAFCEADDPVRVRDLMSMAEGQLAAMAVLLRHL